MKAADSLTYALADTISTVFDMPWDEAIDWFLKRVPVDRAFFYAFEDAIRQKYFTVSRVESSLLIEQIQDRVAAAMDEGLTIQEFARDVDELFEAMGTTKLAPWHVDLVYAQNIRTAYSAGYYEQWQDPELGDTFPFWQYVCLFVNSRESHEAMHGHVFRRGDPDGDQYLPPNGFNCHCQAVLVDKYQAEDEGIKADRNAPRLASGAAAVPDEGFATNPADAFYAVPRLETV